MQGQYKRQLISLRTRYRESLGEKSTQLGILRDEIGQNGAQSLQALAQLLHTLAGSAAVFGLAHISAHAALIERQVLAQKPGASEEDKAALTAALDDLIAEVRALASPDHLNWADEYQVEGARNARPVFILEDDDLYGQWLQAQLQQHGYRAEVFTDEQALQARLGKEEPLALLIDIMLESGQMAGIELLETIVRQRQAQNRPPLPAIVISMRDEFEGRLRAVRAGAAWYLTKPVDFDQLLMALDELVEKRPREPYRVMLVDDDEDLLKLYRLFLEEKGIEVETVSNPLLALNRIHQFRPELIILDVYMPQCTGIELGQVIRQHQRLANIPIVFLSVEDNPDKQLKAMRLAGDDFLTKPIEPWRLTQSVLARVRRARMVNRYIRTLVKDLAYKERHDALTGLPNRQVFEMRLKAAMERQRQSGQGVLALMLMDVDNFQYFNDAYGHEVGDALILDIAQRLSSVIPDDAVLSRQGGDEFALMLPKMPDVKTIQRFCSQINRVAALPFYVAGQEIELGMSIGVVLFSGQETGGPKDLIKHADTALFHAKNVARGGFVFFEEAMAEALRHRVATLNELRRGITLNQLVLYVQPQVDARTDALCGAEMLVRWQHPERGLLPPAEFIDLAETTGLILDLGHWVLERALTCIERWQRLYGWQGPVAVNVSPQQFGHDRFLDELGKLLESVPVAKGALELEITESVLARQPDQVVETLNRIRNMGVRIAIDDFGTGFSNLAALKQYPLDLLKVDRSFVDGLPDEEDDAIIASTILSMGRNLGYRTLAEGVETTAQLEWLRAQGCDVIQGYLKARPMPIDEFEQAWLQVLQQDAQPRDS